MNFPIYRPRRLRRNERLRELIRETSLEPRNFIYPLFVGPGRDKAQPISSMPGIAQLSVDRVVGECAEDDKTSICRDRRAVAVDVAEVVVRLVPGGAHVDSPGFAQLSVVEKDVAIGVGVEGDEIVGIGVEGDKTAPGRDERVVAHLVALDPA